MGRRAQAGACLQALVKMAVPPLREAEHRCPRTGPGAKPDFPDWLIGTLIMVAVLKRKKSKSAQFRFLREKQNRAQIAEAMGCDAFPSRSKFFRHYKRAHRLFRTGRRFLCSENRRGIKRRRGGPLPAPRDERHRRRLARLKFLKSRKGKRLYARCGQTVEPFNDWFKGLFELDQRVWHRGLDNNRTQILAAIFGYQLLVRYNHRRGNDNGRVNRSKKLATRSSRRTRISMCAS